MNKQSGVIWTGLGLIALGIAFLTAMAVGWDRFWPIFPVLGGLAFLAAFVGSGFSGSPGSRSASAAQQGTACHTAGTRDHAGAHAATRHRAGGAGITCRMPVSRW